MMRAVYDGRAPLSYDIFCIKITLASSKRRAGRVFLQGLQYMYSHIPHVGARDAPLAARSTKVQCQQAKPYPLNSAAAALFKSHRSEKCKRLSLSPLFWRIRVFKRNQHMCASDKG